ncbi:putative nucleotidyltransferase with HDIG domain [Sinobaca qinghaiensis]|uniref:Putative nucleotidyltransferase with HDIG domain n=1 Tax=Sinobaca qinghaiensis TaxID=342944 RepID=A0A419V8I2_9BACL|nr:HD domain-containing protein [Sinobaca qinghaiensis]RKD76372.1 putative nucleotidyltransferase with HDIG domain [Sinobaca qinghaiensis]
MKYIAVKELKEGAVIAEDIYKGTSLVVRKGHVVTAALIRKLQQWEINSLPIQSDEEEKIEEKNIDLKKLSEEKRQTLLTFLQDMLQLGNEYRFGYAINDVDSYLWVQKLFVEITSEKSTYRLLQQLKDWDLNTYHHSLDVFILGSLIAKKIGLEHVSEFSRSCLLHDIGKLRVEKKILTKSSELSSREMLQMRAHTGEGYHLLKQKGHGSFVTDILKYHHQPLSALSGEEEIQKQTRQKELDLLRLVDVYSALTLERPYRQSLSAPKALKIVIQEHTEINIEYMKAFCEMLEIFPQHAVVQLSNNTIAEVVEVDDKLPTYPIMKEKDKLHAFYMPVDRSIIISKVLRFKE